MVILHPSSSLFTFLLHSTNYLYSHFFRANYLLVCK